MKIILTGATGMVGEGVLLSLLNSQEITQVLVIGRKKSPHNHEKLKEILLSDFSEIGNFAEQLHGYDACFFCAGVSSVGESEETFYQKTFDVVVPFARELARINNQMVFTYISGKGTDSSETGKTMWARVKGKTENALLKLNFRGVYNFRPGFMKPVEGQKNLKGFFKITPYMYAIMKKLFPDWTSTLDEVAFAMVFCVKNGYEKNIIEVADIAKICENKK